MIRFRRASVELGRESRHARSAAGRLCFPVVPRAGAVPSWPLVMFDNLHASAARRGGAGAWLSARRFRLGALYARSLAGSKPGAGLAPHPFDIRPPRACTSGASSPATKPASRCHAGLVGDDFERACWATPPRSGRVLTPDAMPRSGYPHRSLLRRAGPVLAGEGSGVRLAGFRAWPLSSWRLMRGCSAVLLDARTAAPRSSSTVPRAPSACDCKSSLAGWTRVNSSHSRDAVLAAPRFAPLTFGRHRLRLRLPPWLVRRAPASGAPLARGWWFGVATSSCLNWIARFHLSGGDPGLAWLDRASCFALPCRYPAAAAARVAIRPQGSLA